MSDRSKLNRRTLVRGAAGLGASAVALKGSGALASPIAVPTFLRSSRQSSTEIVFSHIWGTPPGQEAAATKHPVEQLIEAYNAKNTGVTVKSRTDATNYFDVLQKVQAELAAGDAPAMAATPWSNINYAVQGLNVDNLEDVASAAGGSVSDLLANLKPEVISLVTVDGGTKGVPFAFSCPVLYTNDDLIGAAGVDPATLLATWSGLAEQGVAVKDSSSYPVIGFSTNRDWPAQSIVQSNGGRIVNDAGELAFDSAEGIEALQAIAALNDAGLYYNATTAEIRPSFVAGALGVMQGSIAGLGGLTKEVTFNMTVHPFPTFGEKPRQMNSGGSFIGVYARDDEQKAATWDFLKFVVSEEGMNIWLQTGYLNATTFDIPQLPGQEAAYLQLSEGLTRETAWPGSRGAEMQKLWEDYVNRIWTGDISAEDGVKEAKEELSTLIS